MASSQFLCTKSRARWEEWSFYCSPTPSQDFNANQLHFTNTKRKRDEKESRFYFQTAVTQTKTSSRLVSSSQKKETNTSFFSRLVLEQ